MLVGLKIYSECPFDNPGLMICNVGRSPGRRAMAMTVGNQAINTKCKNQVKNFLKIIVYYPEVLTGHLVFISFHQSHKQFHNSVQDRRICQ